MNSQQFLAEFGHIANAPGGIARLRNLILHLAASGDLVQMEVPVDATPLIDSIELQKKEHPEKKKVVKKQAAVSRTAVKAQPHWVNCRLGDLTLTITGGGTPSKNNPRYWGGDIPWASVKDLKNLKYLDDTEDHITEDGLKNSSTNLIPPNRLIVCTRMGLGKIAINRVAMAINQDLKALELPREVIPEFFLILYKTRNIEGRGMTVAGIKQDKLLALPAALPPLEEQSHIVAKVDELMALCDLLEKQQQDHRKLQNALRQSTLQAVASAQSPHDLETAWTRLSENFGKLFSAPEDVGELRSLCVELSIRGDLVPLKSVASEETAGELIRQLAERKSGKRFAKISELEEPFSLPSNWEWVLFEDLLHGSDSGWSPKCDAESRRPGEWGVLKVSAVTWGEFRPDENKRLPLSLDPRPECEVQPGDFLLSRANTAELVARGVVVMNDVPERLMMSDKIVRLNFIDPELKAWANLVNNSQYAREHYMRNATGTSDSMRNVSRQVIHELPIPLPPKSVQKKMLSKLRQLQRLCDNLQIQLSDAEKQAERLAASAVASLTGIAIEQEEDAPVKAPQTELIAPLRLGQTPDIKAQAPLATLLVRHNGEMSAKDLWQRFGGDIDAFYAQLKTEVVHGWIREPAPAQMREIYAASEDA